MAGPKAAVNLAIRNARLLTCRQTPRANTFVATTREMFATTRPMIAARTPGMHAQAFSASASPGARAIACLIAA
jgi:hypothetical protein